MARRVLGIDLGTTNTCVAALDGGRPLIIPNAEGGRTTPSVVAFTETGVLVGEPARRQAVTNPTNTIHSAKRLMGLTASAPAAQALKSLVAFPVVADDQGRAAVRAGGKVRSPVEVSAVVLRTVRAAAEDFFGEDCSAAVITCPAYFDEAQRAATQDAARVAGLDVLRVLSEPTAAALAYSWHKDREGRLVVYDFGGGTFDCSVLQCAGGIIKVLSTRGVTNLGGGEIDEKLMQALAEAYYRQHGAEIPDDPTTRARLRDAAERAKIDLSSAAETEVALPYIAVEEGAPRHLQTTLTRTRLESLVAPLVQDTLRCCQEALADAGLVARDIDDVLLVGGTTKIPMIHKRVEEFFGRTPRRGISPDEAIAMGAAIQAAVLDGQEDDVLLLDVLPLSLGIAAGPNFVPILHRNQSLPCSRTERFSTARDFQSAVLVKTYQGDHERVADNRLIGTVRLENLPPARAGQVQVDVSFQVDENGILEVEARDPRTGKKAALTLRDTTRLSPDELRSLRRQVAGDDDDDNDDVLA